MGKYELGVIGAGNMAEAALRGAIESGFISAGRIVASDPDPARRERFGAELAIACVTDNASAAACDRILLAVKPQVMADVLGEISPCVGEGATVVSIAAGITTAFLDASLGGKGRIVRVMPNTPMLVGAGMSAIAAGPRATDEDVQWTEGLFAASGRTVPVDEDLMDTVTGVSGSGPAYVFYLIEAMIAAGMADGCSYELAYQLSVQTCAGAAKLLAESGQKPEDLRAMVTSPNGTTQRAVEVLEAAGAKDALIAAFRAATTRSRELGEQNNK